MNKLNAVIKKCRKCNEGLQLCEKHAQEMHDLKEIAGVDFTDSLEALDKLKISKGGEIINDTKN